MFNAEHDHQRCHCTTLGEHQACPAPCLNHDPFPRDCIGSPRDNAPADPQPRENECVARPPKYGEPTRRVALALPEAVCAALEAIGPLHDQIVRACRVVVHAHEIAAEQGLMLGEVVAPTTKAGGVAVATILEPGHPANAPTPPKPEQVSAAPPPAPRLVQPEGPLPPPPGGPRAGVRTLGLLESDPKCTHPPGRRIGKGCAECGKPDAHK